MSQELEALKAQITETKTVGDSLATMVTGLAAQIQAGKDDPAAMMALANDLRGKTDQWKQAVLANTPQATA